MKLKDLYEGLYEGPDTNIFELNKNLEKILYAWCGGQKIKARDNFLTLNIPNRYRQVPGNKAVFRYVYLKPALVKKALKTPMQLQKKYKTSSWSTLILGRYNRERNGLIPIVIKKQIKINDILIYMPNLLKYHRNFIRHMDTCAREAITTERELIVKNTSYWTLIKPKEIIMVNGEGGYRDFLRDYK